MNSMVSAQKTSAVQLGSAEALQLGSGNFRHTFRRFGLIIAMLAASGSFIEFLFFKCRR